MRHSFRKFVGGSATAATLAAFLAIPAGSTAAPGISNTQVSIGAIVTQSGGAAADFAPYLAGAQAYFHYINDKYNGVFNRKLVITDALDDQSNPTTNIADARTLVTADHVFGIVGVSTGFFSGSQFLSTSGVPTFGYATQNVWKGPKNFFADYGSVIDYATSTPDFGYVAKQVHATRVAVIALNYPSSQDECKPSVQTLKSTYGINVVYSNLYEPIFTPNFSTDVTQMITKGVDMVISCMDYNNNIALSRAMNQQGMNPVPQVWLDGYDRNILRNNAIYMNNVYVMIQHVPFEATTSYPGKFPGLSLYFTEMAKYGYANQQYDDVALMGWESANLFTEGLRSAGANPTQAAVISAINKLKSDFGGPVGYGVATPVNWTLAHTANTPPSCIAFVKTVGIGGPSPSPAFKMAFNRGKDPWICFPLTGKANLASPLLPPAGTPGL